MQKLLTFFQQKIICVSLIVNFNESLTNDVVSFEQLGPGGCQFEPRRDQQHSFIVIDHEIFSTVFSPFC